MLAVNCAKAAEEKIRRVATIKPVQKDGCDLDAITSSTTTRSGVNVFPQVNVCPPNRKRLYLQAEDTVKRISVGDGLWILRPNDSHCENACWRGTVLRV